MKTIGWFLLLVLAFPCTHAHAVQTRVMVRALAKDAKFIGTSMGGAMVIVKDSDTGQTLANGLTTGGTGNTHRIIEEPWVRRAPLADGDTAGFEFSLDIEEPRLVTIEVYAPYAQKQSLTKTTKQIWVIPGKHVTGDGIVVEVYGFAMDLMLPQNHEGLSLKDGPLVVPVKANIVMMCGCPIAPGGLWDANQYQVEALIKKDGKIIGRQALSAADKVSTFVGELRIGEPGVYEVIACAFDPVTGNSGIDKSTLIVSP